jgi:probable phosphoglycerate mutase
MRHAETHNPKDVLYGRLPRFDLSTRGREQAAATAEKLAGLPLEAIYHSPLLRARRTAQIVAAHHSGIPVRQSALLLENLHPYQGRPHADIAKLGERAYDPDILGETGETVAAVTDRMARFLRRVERRHRGGVIAAIAHADPLAALRLYLLKKELLQRNLRAEAPPLASVFRVDLMEGGEVRLDWFWKPAAPPTPAEQPAAPSVGENGHQTGEQAGCEPAAVGAADRGST